MTCDRKICYQQDYNGGCETCPCNEEDTFTHGEHAEGPKLKPCPFCGGEGEIKRYYIKGTANCSHYYIQCKQCRAAVKNTSGYRKIQKAINAWNRRWNHDMERERRIP